VRRCGPNFNVPAGWTVTRVLSGVTEINGNRCPCAELTKSRVSSNFGSEVAKRLDLHSDDRVVVGGQSLVVNIAGGGQSITVATPLAHRSSATTAGGSSSRPPVTRSGSIWDWSSAASSGSLDVDPSVKPDPNGAA